MASYANLHLTHSVVYHSTPPCTYRAVIIGAGPSGIGIHRDVDHSVSDKPPPVSTYLTVVRGRKHVVVLPPDQTLFPVDDK